MSPLLSVSKHGLRGLEAVLRAQEQGQGLPPVHLWEPDYCGEIGLKIARDGTWFYLGSPIGRKELVKLFSRVLRRDDDGYYLVTPVEKIAIDVEDAPFVAVEMEVRGESQDQTLIFRTNVGDVVACDDAHPLRFEPEEHSGGLKPYVHVRAGLEALVSRALYYDIVELALQEKQGGVELLGVWSGGRFAPMMPAEDLARAIAE